MQWLNIHARTLDSEAFVCAEPVDQATWLKLLRYCMGQENGGLISGAKAWSDRQCQQLVHAKLEEVLHTCPLWEWVGDDLKVAFYPAEQELAVQAKRRAARSTNAMRYAKRHAECDAERDAKEREEKGKEGEGNHPPANRPSIEEAIEYFAKSGFDYTAREVRDVWSSFEATIQDGLWFFGRRLVGDWRSAMETRLSDYRKKAAPGITTNGHPAGWQEGDDDLWWTGELALVEAAAAGAWIAEDQKKAARMDAIIAQRKGGR